MGREPAVPREYRWRVQQRLAVLEYAAAHGIRRAAQRFGLDRKTVRAWRNRARAGGIGGLVQRYPKVRPRRVPAEVTELIAQARREFGFGAPRIRLWLRRVHQVQLAVATIQRTVAELGFPPIRRTRKRRPRQLKLFEREQPGECVQVDVKFVKVGGQRMFQYTALDDCTRLRVLRLYRRLNYWSSLDFLGEIRRAFPFPIRKLQSDRGAEFPLAFALSVREAGIKHRYIQPRRPEQNGKVERSHRIDEEEFWSRSEFPDYRTAAQALLAWERYYNHERFSMALQGRTPGEKLAAAVPPAA
ncbi:MAG TPA: integrase core domain-containing protein [Gemmatimonadales bacterium]|nr:integrase core domain-containing protein [Gemmatimonadales bacterium]